MLANPGRVLIVDDDAAVRDALKFALEIEGLAVRVYASGAELLADEMPSRGCVVIDYAMPAMNGLQVADALRSRRIGLPTILIAGNASGDLRARAAQAGFGQVLEKPLTDAALIDGIRAALGADPVSEAPRVSYRDRS